MGSAPLTALQFECGIVNVHWLLTLKEMTMEQAAPLPLPSTSLTDVCATHNERTICTLPHPHGRPGYVNEWKEFDQ